MLRDPFQIHFHSTFRFPDIFVKHEAYNALAVFRIHLHFYVAANEKLVEFSTPWMYCHADGDLVGGSIRARSWLFKDGKTVPYESGYNEYGQKVRYGDLPNKPGFYADFHPLFRKEGLADMLRLTLITKRHPKGFMKVEKKFGRANVVSTMKEDDCLLNQKDSAPA